METVVLERVAPGRWRWLYSDGNGARALSNEVYESPIEAECAAQVAYPDLPIVHAGDEQPRSEVVEERARAVLKVALLIVLAVLAVALGRRIAGARRATG